MDGSGYLNGYLRGEGSEGPDEVSRTSLPLAERVGDHFESGRIAPLVFAGSNSLPRVRTPKRFCF